MFLTNTSTIESESNLIIIQIILRTNIKEHKKLKKNVILFHVVTKPNT